MMAILPLCGCLDQYNHKDGTPITDKAAYQADREECFKYVQNNRPGPDMTMAPLFAFGAIGGAIAGAASEPGKNDQTLLDECMVKKGYEIIKK